VQDAILAELAPTVTEAELLEYSWEFWGRPSQLPPAGDWLTWLILSGRGWGKTRTGGQWVHDRALEHDGRWIALVAKTPADARDYMVEGPGGILRNTHPAERPDYEPSKRRLTWPNGSWATIYSSEDPDQLRGFSGDTAWLDELAKYKNPRECWDNLEFGMREVSEDQPRKLVTTTPRPLPLLEEIEEDPDTHLYVGTSYENRANLSPVWFTKTLQKYEGTRLGQQEIHGIRLDDVDSRSSSVPASSSEHPRPRLLSWTASTIRRRCTGRP
jgi:phage terminase large subunit-like protein